MRRSRIPLGGTLSFLLLTGPAALWAAADPPAPRWAQVERGEALYREHCSRCHGATGLGYGPQAESLRYRPTDLTLLSRDAGGRFPAARVTRVIDGRRPLVGHGGPEMPIWGDLLKTRENAYDDDDVRDAIAAMVAYLESIQRARGR